MTSEASTTTSADLTSTTPEVEGSTPKVEGSTPEVEDSTAEDDDDDAKPAALVDLSNEPTGTAIQISQDANNAEQSLKQASRKKRLRLATEDVVDLTASPASKPTADPANAYKQALGPIRMEFCTDFYPPHAFIKQPQNPNLKTNKIYHELVEYQLNLPIQPSSSVFVRAMESRLDLLRVAITGPESTPYEHGVFLFDVHLHDYPNASPKVKFLTTGGGRIRFNPNLYKNGKVCLSLLGTWLGPGWVSGKSTLLQVLVSIQGLVLVNDPFFNEPGYKPGPPKVMRLSEQYNKEIRQYTLQYAIRDMLQAALPDKNGRAKPKPGQALYSEFAAVVKRHFAVRSPQLREQLAGWIAKDSTLTAMARQVEALLDQVQEVVGAELSRGAQATTQATVATAETIELSE